MLRVQLICTGKLKESFYAAACEEYNKRLQRYCAPEIIELPETGDIKRDGAAMLARIGSGAFIVAMCIEGKSCSSEELASLMAQCAVQEKAACAFSSAAPDGLSDEVKARRGRPTFHVAHDIPAPSGAGHGSGADLPRLQYQRGREIS